VAELRIIDQVLWESVKNAAGRSWGRPPRRLATGTDGGGWIWTLWHFQRAGA